MPAHNRLADNWRPLFAVAHVIGGHWPQRAADAFTVLGAPKGSEGGLLLTALHRVMLERGLDRITSRDLVAALCALPDAAWLKAADDGGPIDQLSSRKAFIIRTSGTCS